MITTDVSKPEENDVSQSSNIQTDTTPIKRKVGRPRKSSNGTTTTKKKLTLKEKQLLKLKIQKEREAHSTTKEKNKERFYCTNKELQAELMKWRDSAENVSDRIISEELGRMFLAIANKLLNHSNFKNYTKELKEDMRSYGLYKVIRGLKNYNFEFNNPFAWVTQAFWNSYVSIITKHYKHINIKKEMLKKFILEFECINGISPNNSINRCLRNYLGCDLMAQQSENNQ